jgi:hypothetical protein
VAVALESGQAVVGSWGGASNRFVRDDLCYE